MNKFAVPENVAADLRSRISVAEWEEARRHFATGLVAACDIFERDARSQFLN
jgi:hypothetical protein